MRLQTRSLRRGFAALGAASGLASTATCAETPSPATPQSPPCAAPAFHQFDFWVGRWDVYNSGGRERAGSSTIERLYDGCAIRENWNEPGLTGGSLNSYDPAGDHWRQTWVDASGAQRDFVGGMEGGRMVLTSTYPSARAPGATARERMIFTPNPDGSVRQYSDASLDGGKTWVPRYDYTYRRADPSAVVLPTNSPAAAPGCGTPESGQFDFWIGHWDVFAAAKPDQKVADSLIEKLYGGCAVRENWKPLKSAGGGSLSAYLPSEHGWRQTWVDNGGSRVNFKGAWDGTAMVLTGVWPQPGHLNQLTRMKYTRSSDGGVRQLGETSDDNGGSWQPGFEFLYRRSN